VVFIEGIVIDAVAAWSSEATLISALPHTLKHGRAIRGYDRLQAN
jgi:hypothetical protein